MSWFGEEVAAHPAFAKNRPMLRRGNRGPFVKEWQTIVKTTKIDGIFGPETEKMTKAWQKAHNLKVDGKVGPETWKSGLTSLSVQGTIAARRAAAAQGTPMPGPDPVVEVLPSGMVIARDAKKKNAYMIPIMSGLGLVFVYSAYKAVKESKRARA